MQPRHEPGEGEFGLGVEPRRGCSAARRLQRTSVAAAAAACIFAATPARGALPAVSGSPEPAVNEVLAGDPPATVAYSLANGFPLWYRDQSGLKLQLCLDHEVELTPGVAITPCLTAKPFPTLPLSFPSNFGTEALFWTASGFTPFASTLSVDGVITQVFAGDALLVLSLEASFQNLIPIDGEQAVFGRIRIRANLPIPGTYRITHPYGQADYTVTAISAVREINQTQDIGNMPPHVLGLPTPPAGPPPRGDFTLALQDGPEPLTGPFDPAIDAGVISAVATGLGPFLLPAATPGGAPLAPVVAANGAVYLFDPGTDFAPNTTAITGGVDGVNAFTIELLDPPPGFVLNQLDGTQTVRIDQFQVMGKVFDDGPNAAPLARPDSAATAKDRPVTIDVLANDLDVVEPTTNRHGLDPQALGLPSIDGTDLPGTILLTEPLITANGGTAQRATVFSTGETTFVYTPAPGFTGTDTFEYVVQDTGGLVSAPATVSVLVEDVVVTGADYRARTGKWHVRGTTTAPEANVVTLYGSPRAILAGANVTPPVVSGARGAATFAVRPDAIDFRLALDVLPGSTVTAAHLHLGAPGTSGPAVFFLFDEPVNGPFTGARVARLTPARLLFVPDQLVTFEDVVAAVVAGQAYVDVHTTSFPDGELRGQISAPLIGSAPVDAAGAFSFTGHSRASPGAPPATVTAVSGHGIRTATAPLRMR